MKMILAILRDHDSEGVSQALISAGLRVTRVASTGGFLRRGSTTFMIGVSDEQVDQAIQVIRDNVSTQTEPGIKRATLFVLPVDSFTQI
jgi:uncharacterized protein YaaQ